MCSGGGSRGSGAPPAYTTAALQTHIDPSGNRTGLNYTGKKSDVRQGKGFYSQGGAMLWAGGSKGLKGKIAEIVGGNVKAGAYNPHTGMLISGASYKPSPPKAPQEEIDNSR